MFLDPFSCAARQGIDGFCLLRRFRAMPKSYVFLLGQCRRQFFRKSALWRPRGDSSARVSRKCHSLRPGVPGAASRARTGEETAVDQLVQDLTRHGPMARRFLRVFIVFL